MATHIRLALLTAIAPLLWGTTYIVTSEFLPPDRPLLVGALRALPAGLLLLAIGRTLPRGIWWWRAAILGMLNFGIFFAMLFFAAYRLPGGIAATVGSVQPFLVALLAWPLLAERPNGAILSGAFAGMVGVGLIALNPAAQLDALGLGAALAGAVASASGQILSRRWQKPVGLVPFTAWQLVFGGLFLLGLALLIEGPPPALSTPNLLGFGYLSFISTGLGYLFWFRGVLRLPTVSTAILILLSPCTAVILGWVILGQTLTALQLVGIGVILGSIALVQFAGARAHLRLHYPVDRQLQGLRSGEARSERSAFRKPL